MLEAAEAEATAAVDVAATVQSQAPAVSDVLVGETAIVVGAEAEA